MNLRCPLCDQMVDIGDPVGGLDERFHCHGCHNDLDLVFVRTWVGEVPRYCFRFPEDTLPCPACRKLVLVPGTASDVVERGVKVNCLRCSRHLVVEIEYMGGPCLVRGLP